MACDWKREEVVPLRSMDAAFLRFEPQEDGTVHLEEYFKLPGTWWFQDGREYYFITEDCLKLRDRLP